MSYAYFRFFPGDYMRDTMHLGWFEDLAYRRLIDLYCLHGKPIRNDRSYILRALRAGEPEQQQAVDNVLSEFFVLRSDGWHQKKCDAEIRFRQKKSEDGSKGANARWNNDINATALPPHTDPNANQNHINPIVRKRTRPTPEGFDEFWSVYPKKEKRKDSEAAWLKLNPDPNLLSTIIRAVTHRVKNDPQWSRDGGKYVPMPTTYLNGRRWEDFITATAGPVRKLAI